MPEVGITSRRVPPRHKSTKFQAQLFDFFEPSSAPPQPRGLARRAVAAPPLVGKWRGLFKFQSRVVTTRGHRYSATTLLLPIQAQGILGEAV